MENTTRVGGKRCSDGVLTCAAFNDVNNSMTEEKLAVMEDGIGNFMQSHASLVQKAQRQEQLLGEKENMINGLLGQISSLQGQLVNSVAKKPCRDAETQFEEQVEEVQEEVVEKKKKDVKIEVCPSCGGPLV